MIGLVLVTHGRLAVEFITAMEHVVGPQEAVEGICIDADDDMEARRKDIADAIQRVDRGKGVIILTDLFGGTPSNLAISLMKSEDVEVIAGVNLPMLIRLEGARKVMGDPANVSLITAVYDGSKGPTGIVRRRQDMLCVNPLNGTMDGSAPPEANPGTLVPDGDLTNASLEPGRVGATCRQGFLYIDGNIPELGPYVLPGNNYHVYDFALFWGAVRRDAERRLQAWRR